MKMKIRDAAYAGTVYDKLPELPEIAFAGRSNVGKSSLINALLNRKDLVRTSKQPGKTRNINYFAVDAVDLPPFYMVDLPGYGYARVSKDMKDVWDRLAGRYFSNNNNLKILFLLLDVRRAMQHEERLALEMARSCGARTLVVATKVDKLKSSEKQRIVRGVQADVGGRVLICSAFRKIGLDELWDEIVAGVTQD